MDLTLERKACAACAKAKRRCGKQIPACSRCESRSITCEYPSCKTFHLPPRHPTSSDSRSPRRQTNTAVLDHTPLDPSMPDTFFHLPGEAMAVDDIFALNFDTTAISSPLSIIDLNPKRPSLPWYLEPSSWEIESLAHSEFAGPICNSVLTDYIEQIQCWQARWVKKGSSPYIHKYIYRFQYPRCIQDAYTMLSTYLNRTPENKDVVEAFLEERIRHLLRDQPPAGEDDGPDAHQNLSTFEHMARVHALHIYQTICLFDGAIRLRHVAETQIPTLNLWLRQLLASASALASRGPEAFVLSLILSRDQQQQQQQQQQPKPSRMPARNPNDPGLVVNQYVPTLPPPPPSSLGGGVQLDGDSSILTPENTAWYAWAFAETIRRTWMVACATQTIYLTLQLRWAPCPGGTKATTREGLWEADSAFAWAEAIKDLGGGGGVDFLSRDAWEDIMERRTPDQVDEYLLASLQISFGFERMARWKAKAAAVR